MDKFTCVEDIGDLRQAVAEALEIKRDRFQFTGLGRNKTLLMLFFNSSLRTRLSTQKAAMNLGMNVMVLDVNQGAWKLETQRGVVMDGDKAEHLLEAIPVMGSYCDVIGVRSFARFQDKAEDYEERVLEQFIRHSGRPVFSMEAATRHPLQSFADLITIEEHKAVERPKVVMTWAPHPNALPQAVPNSFAEWMNATDYDFVITHPEGYELDPKFVGAARVEYNQRKALEGADFVYAKNWAAYTDPNYGKVLSRDRAWTVDAEKMALTNNARFMHCLPVRRNMIVTDEVIESPRSLVIPRGREPRDRGPGGTQTTAGGSELMERITVVKIGGNVIDNPAAMKRFLKEFAALEGPKILVHGGGKLATRLAERLELKVQMVDGRRITDKGTLDVVTMVYAGLINKQAVAGLQAAGCNALGLSGADGNAVTARRRSPQPVDYGFVGDIERVDSALLRRLLEDGMAPVFSAIMHDGKGTLLNCNADSVASAVALGAAEIAPTDLVFCFEKAGVLRDPDDDTSLIREITAATYPPLKADGVVSKGMIPKIENALKAVEKGVRSVTIRSSENLSTGIGTVIRNS